MTWKQEHSETFAVPQEIEVLPYLEDVSWHNDACPSFATKDNQLRIWVEHPLYDDRESGGSRFTIHHCTTDGDLVSVTWHGEDLANALSALRSAFHDIYGEWPPSTADAWLANAKAKILADMRAGQLSENTSSFADLHGRVDANEYLLEAFEAGETPIEKLRNANTLADRLDLWIKGGGLDPAKPTWYSIPGIVAAKWRDGRIEKISFTPALDAIAEHESGPDPEIDTQETDGPFWKSVQDFLGAGNEVAWEE